MMHQLEAALARRAALATDTTTTAYRLVNGEGDGLPGLVAERYGPLRVVSLYEGEADERNLWALVDGLAAHEPGAIYLRRRPRQASGLSAAQLAALAPAEPVRGIGGVQAVALEHGLRYLVRMDQGLSCGIFLDMREVRAEVRRLAAGQTVLNTFAYTCAFGVAAASGGAARVLNLDASRAALDWGKENYALNTLPTDEYDFVYGDVFDWLRRFARRGQQFDITILDPPSYSTTRTTRWVLERHYDALVALAVEVTAPKGLLLACANQRSISTSRLRSLVLQGLRQAGRTARTETALGSPALDFPHIPGDEGALKVLALRLD